MRIIVSNSSPRQPLRYSLTPCAPIDQETYICKDLMLQFTNIAAYIYMDLDQIYLPPPQK